MHGNLISYVFLLCVLIFYSPFSVFAGIRVSDLVIALEIPAGRSYTGSFTVSHTGEKPESIIISLADWGRDIDGKHRYFDAGTLPHSLADWIEFSPLRFKLNGRKTQEVKFSIAVPKEGKGTHWTMFVVEGTPQVIAIGKEGEHQFSVMAGVAYGIKIYQTDPATAERKARITDLDITVSNKSEETEIKAKIEFENTGNTHLESEGKVDIRDEKGETVATVDIRRFPILPGAKRILEIPFEQKNLQPGTYLALAVLDFEGNYLVAGQRVFEIGKN